MSVNSSDLGRLLLAAMLATFLTGCVTTAEQTASQSDLVQFSRMVDSGGRMSNLDPEQLESSAKKMVKTPIDFYGLVLSESGNPLKGAIVKPTVFDRLADPFEFPYFSFKVEENLITDGKGRFKITGLKGAGMYVLVQVPGWQPVTAPRKLFIYAEGLDQTLPLPTQEDPAVFQFERRPPEAELKPIRTGAMQLEDDGVELELSLREVAPYGVEPGTGEARVTCSRSVDDAAPDALFDWWCDFTIPGGGSIPFRLDMDRAPADGYQETVRFGYTGSEADWDDRDDRELVVRFADGHYASITLSMRMDGDFYVAVDGVWNPSGSNWLD